MKKIQVIAEIANYWQGSEEVLEDTIHAAAVCQVDFVKVQLPDSKRVGKPWKHKKANIKENEIGENKLNEIKSQCNALGIKLLATAHHANKIELLQRTDVSNVKIASGQLHPLLVGAIREHKWERVFVSTGMIEDPEDLNLLSDLKECTEELIIMHCVSLYPTHDPELNLSRIHRLSEMWGKSDTCKVTVGYSDHHMDDLPALLAVGLGAEYIEKHFRIDDSFGPTSEIALKPEEMGNFVGLCKRMGLMFGNAQLCMQDREVDSYEHYKTRYVI